jgi:hypothetical protein
MQHDEDYFMVMEYVPGRMLASAAILLLCVLPASRAQEVKPSLKKSW